MQMGKEDGRKLQQQEQQEQQEQHERRKQAVRLLSVRHSHQGSGGYLGVEQGAVRSTVC